MSAEHTAPRRPFIRRRDPATLLKDAIAALGDHHGQLVTTREKAWASITFAGSRHTMTWLFAGETAVEAGERMIAALPEHEFAIPHQLVADATVLEVEHRLLPSPRLVVTCELLVLDDA